MNVKETTLSALVQIGNVKTLLVLIFVSAKKAIQEMEISVLVSLSLKLVKVYHH